MLSRPAIKASTTPIFLARRGFRSTAARFSSPYHYPEGPGSNLPFNIKTKYFGVRYWATMGNFQRLFPSRLITDVIKRFFSTFPSELLVGAFIPTYSIGSLFFYSLANLQEQIKKVSQSRGRGFGWDNCDLYM